MLIRDSELQRRMANLDDEQLLEIVTTRRTEYKPAALDVAAKELMRRRVSFELPSAGKSGLTPLRGWTTTEDATHDELEATGRPALTPALGTILTSGDKREWTRKEKLAILFMCCLALSFAALNLYESSLRNSPHLAEKIIYWSHIALAIPVILKICGLPGRKLPDKI